MPSTPFLPIPLLGTDVYPGTVTGLNVAANGALSRSSSVVTFLAQPPNLSNTGRSVNATGSPGHQEINAMNTRQRNQVIIDDGFTLEIKMFNVNNTTDPAPMISLFEFFDYFFVEWTEGTAPGSIYQNEFYGVRGDIDHPLEGRGEQITTARFLECDPGYPTVAQYSRYNIG